MIGRLAGAGLPVWLLSPPSSPSIQDQTEEQKEAKTKAHNGRLRAAPPRPRPSQPADRKLSVVCLELERSLAHTRQARAKEEGSLGAETRDQYADAALGAARLECSRGGGGATPEAGLRAPKRRRSLMVVLFSLLTLLLFHHLVAICPASAHQPHQLQAPFQTIGQLPRSPLSPAGLSALMVHLGAALLYAAQPKQRPISDVVAAAAASAPKSASIKIGVLLEESDHEQANMFIRTIKMINEQKDETIGRLWSLFAQQQQQQQHQHKPMRIDRNGAASRARLTSPKHTTPGKQSFKYGQQPFGSTNQAAATQPGDSADRPRSHVDVADDDDDGGDDNNDGDDDDDDDDEDAISAAVAGDVVTAENDHAQDRPEGAGLAVGPAAISGQVEHDYRDSTESISTAGGKNSAGPGDKDSENNNNKKPSSSFSSSIFGIFGSGGPADGAQPPGSKQLNGNGNNNNNNKQRPAVIRLEPMIEFLSDRQSALEADEKVCQLIESGVRAILGPSDGACIQHVQSICDNLEIPYFELRSFLGGSLAAPQLEPSAISHLNVRARAPRATADRHLSEIEQHETSNTTTAPTTMHPNDDGRLQLAQAAEEPSRLTQTREALLEEAQHQQQEQDANWTNAHEDTRFTKREALKRSLLSGPAPEDGPDLKADSEPQRDEAQLLAGSGTGKAHEQEEAEEEASSELMSNSNNAQQTIVRPLKTMTTNQQQQLRPQPQQATKTSGPQNFARSASGVLMANKSAPHHRQRQHSQQPSQRQQDKKLAHLRELDENNNNNVPSEQLQKFLAHGVLPATAPLAGSSNKLDDITLNLYPPSHLLNSAYIDLIYALNWTSFAVVYEDSSSMIKLQDLIRESSGSWANRWRIKLFRLFDSLSDSMATTSQAFGGASSASSNGGNAAHGADQNLNILAGRTVRTNMEAGGGGADDKQRKSTETGRLRQARLAAGIYSDRLDGHEDNVSLLNDPPSHGHHGQQQQQNLAAAKRAKQGSFRDVFWRVKLSGEQNILLDVRTENLYEALKQAQQVGCMTEEYSFIITSLDLHMIDLEDFKYSRTRITGFSLIQVAKAQQSGLRSSQTKDENQAAASSWGQILGPFFDERYLENLGVYSSSNQQYDAMQQQASQQTARLIVAKNARKTARGRPTITSSHGATMTNITTNTNANNNNNNNNPRGSPDNQFYAEFMAEAENNDQTRRELLQSSPASLSLLPTVDRNNEQRLFDFFVEQQERNVSRVRLSTASAILHDSLMLYALAVNELDPNGTMISMMHGSNPGASSPASSASSGNIGCSLESQPWPHGSSLVNYMRKMSSLNGLSGSISFDQRGLRTDFKLDVMGMAPNIRLIKVGEWHSRRTLEAKHKFAYMSAASAATSAAGPNQAEPDSGGRGENDSRSYDELSERYDQELQKYTRMLAEGQHVEVPYTQSVSPNGALLVNGIIFERLYREQADKVDTLVVTAKLSQPYFMLKETPNKLDGNDQFEGYAVDLIHELSKLVNFKYKWREVADKKYGSKEVLPNGTVVWNGMIGEIVRGQADLAIVDLTITTQRQEAVDFTLPFMNTGISILFKKPTTKVTTLFSFLSPFSSDVWAYVLAAYCGISATLYLVGHLSPYEWADPHPCGHMRASGGGGGGGQDDDEDDEEDITLLKNQFSLLNAFWFTIGSLMQQGSDLTPRSMSTRTIAGIWYFFTLIMISSYTANLAAFLTVEKVVYPIENVRDLSNQQEIKYGCVESGSTCMFFHDSQIDTYKKIDQTMGQHKTYVRSNDEGQKRVGEGKFAFFMESTTIEYIIERNCNLTQIGGLIDSKGYGLATNKKSRHKRPYRTLLNEGILHLQETGMLHVLKNRWWKERRGGGTCTDDGKGGGVTELSLANVGGVFVVLLGGLGISFLVAIAEFMWRARRRGSTRDRMCEEMMNDLKFALACKSSTKPASQKSQPAGSLARRRLKRQQESIMSQYSSNNNNNNNYNLSSMDVYDPQSMSLMVGAQQPKQLPKRTKDCDPILVHAMLTMLMQQQQEQQMLANSSRNNNDNNNAPRRAPPATVSGSDPLLAQVDALRDRLPNGFYQPAHRLVSSLHHSATVDDSMNRLAEAGGHLLPQRSFEEGDGYGNLPGLSMQVQTHSQQQQQQPANWRAMNPRPAPSDELTRRRILLAQRTIDMTG